MRVFAIGDIHGEYYKLLNLFNILYTHHNLDLSKDKIVFMGDYIDRGAYSLQVLEYIYNLQKKHKNHVVVLAGNHEWMMVDWHEGRDKWGLWLVNGGNKTLHSFDPVSIFDYEKSIYDNKCPKKYLKWLKKLPLYHEEPGFFFSHAPIGNDTWRGTNNINYTKEDCIWSYGRGMKEQDHAKQHTNGVVGVCGHVHALYDNKFEPRIYDHYIFTDAGCGCHKDAPLCAVEVISKQAVFSV